MPRPTIITLQITIYIPIQRPKRRMQNPAFLFYRPVPLPFGAIFAITVKMKLVHIFSCFCIVLQQDLYILFLSKNA
jgi:hypothetical protein